MALFVIVIISFLSSGSLANDAYSDYARQLSVVQAESDKFYWFQNHPLPFSLKKNLGQPV